MKTPKSNKKSRTPSGTVISIKAADIRGFFENEIAEVVRKSEFKSRRVLDLVNINKKDLRKSAHDPTGPLTPDLKIAFKKPTAVKDQRIVSSKVDKHANGVKKQKAKVKSLKKSINRAKKTQRRK